MDQIDESDVDEFIPDPTFMEHPKGWAQVSAQSDVLLALDVLGVAKVRELIDWYEGSAA